MNVILNYLGKAEGISIHRNDNESDITAPYGIYRAAHPDASIFEYIDTVAVELGIAYGSSTWNTGVINRVNDELDDNVVRQYAEEFYSEYLASAHLELFPKECKVAAMSMYTNSPKGMWLSVQRSILSMVSNHKIGLIKSEVSIADGVYGKKTEKALKYVYDKIDPDYFETLLLLNMLDYYVDLWKSNPDKYSKYLAGWKNRIVKLSKN